MPNKAIRVCKITKTALGKQIKTASLKGTNLPPSLYCSFYSTSKNLGLQLDSHLLRIKSPDKELELRRLDIVATSSAFLFGGSVSAFCVGFVYLAHCCPRPRLRWFLMKTCVVSGGSHACVWDRTFTDFKRDVSSNV